MRRMVNPKIFILILNWNKPNDTIECIDSCQTLDYEYFEIIVIDNASDDNSVEIISNRFPRITMIVNDQNLGYAGGNNVGIKYALKHGADWVLLLNNDTKVTPTTLQELASVTHYPDVGMVAPRVMRWYTPSIVDSLGTSMDWLRHRPKLGWCGSKDPGYTLNFTKDILVGSALMVSRRLIERIGGLDERFFIYHEEAEWCLRSKKLGFKNLVVPKAVVYHKISETMKDFPALTKYYSTRNFLLLARIHANPMEKVMVWIGLIILFFKRGDKAFRLGVKDFFRGRFGKCQHDL